MLISMYEYRRSVLVYTVIYYRVFKMYYTNEISPCDVLVNSKRIFGDVGCVRAYR